MIHVKRHNHAALMEHRPPESVLVEAEDAPTKDDFAPTAAPGRRYRRRGASPTPAGSAHGDETAALEKSDDEEVPHADS